MAILLLLNAYPAIDIFQKFLLVIEKGAESGAMSYFVTALLLTGGSSTVFKVFEKLREAKGKIQP